ncbi:MAG: Hsp20/alpha crystallin family protein [Phycisphaerae bacterium]
MKQIECASREGGIPPSRNLSRWVDHILGKNFHHFCPADSWSPSINLYEDEKAYYIIAELAGIPTDEIDLHVDGSTLVLSGARRSPKVEDPDGPVRLHLMEIDHGRFCRTLKAPPDVDLDGIEATYRAGFLWIRLPKINEQ